MSEDETVRPGATVTATSDDTARVPAKLPRRFDEVGELGRGGMGRVADAIDTVLGRRVAVKYALSASESATARFEREMQITARLEHPGIVPLYDGGRGADGRPYYVMRRIEGAPLAGTGGLDERLARIPAVLAACDAVAYAHARGFIHRDLKPSNIVVGPFGETLVLDWGLALELPGDDVSVLGTPGFMAPEQARGEPLDRRADVYALGATLFYVLAGEPPHRAGSTTETLATTAAAATPRWDRLPAGVPDDLRAILATAMASDRELRYADAGVLADDLRRFVTGNLVAAHRYTWSQQLVRFVRRHRAAVAITLVAMLVLGTVTMLLVGRVIDARANAATETARARARAADAALARARLLLDTDPTAAIAALVPLARGPRWPEVRGLVAAARARGIATRLASSPRTFAVEITGAHAMTIGSDGIVRMHELATGTTRPVRELGHAVDRKRPALLVALADAFAVLDGSTLVVIGIDGRVRETFAVTAGARSLAAGGGRLAWVDGAHQAFVRDPDTSPRPLGEATAVWLSPDGTRLAIATTTQTTLDGRVVLDKEATLVGWDGDALVVDDRDGRITRLDPDGTRHALGLGWPDAVVARPHGYYYALGRAPMPPALAGDRAAGTYSTVGDARDGLVVTSAPDGTVSIHDGERTTDIVTPIRGPVVVASSATSRYILVTAGDRLLRYDLDQIVPRPLVTLANGEWLMTVGPHHAIVARMQGDDEWLDLRDGTRSPAPEIAMPPRVFAYATAGDRVLELSLDHVARTMRRGTREVVPLAEHVTFAMFLDADRVALVYADGSTEVADLARGTRTPALPVRGKPIYLSVADGVIVVGYEDGSFARTHGGRVTSLAGDGLRGIAQLADGRTCFAAARAVRCWRLDGDTRDYPIPAPVLAVIAIPNGVIADTAEAAYIVDLAHATLTPTLALGTELVPWAQDRYVARTPSRSRDGVFAVAALSEARLVDGATGLWWRVGPHGRPGTLTLVPDGSALVEKRDGVYTTLPIALPAGPGELD